MPLPGQVHSLLTDVDIHRIVRWEHVDETDRLAETLVSTDIGKVSHQLDDDSFWILVDLLPTWDGLDAVGSVDHGALTGLADDDHTQYHTDARGDARYYTQAQVDALITDAGSQLHSVSDTFGGTCLMLWQGNNSNTDETSNHTLGTQGAPEFGLGFVPDTRSGYGTEGNGNWWSTATAQGGGGQTTHRRGNTEPVSAYALIYHDEGNGNSTPYYFMSGVGGAASTINYSLVLVGEELTYQDSGSGGTFGSGIRVPRMVWTHVGFTRDASNVVKLYMNGNLLTTSGALNTPTAAGDFYIGSAGVAANGYIQLGYIQSLKVLDVAISDAQMLSEARRMLGR